MTTKTKFKLGPKQRKWIAALRSGKFRQTTESLLHSKNDGGYCCLGVAKKVLKLKENSIYALRDTHEQLGLISAAGSNKSGTNSLASMNDEGQTFEQIAGKLEKFPRRFFTKAV